MPQMFECELIYQGLNQYDNNIFNLPNCECPINNNFIKFLDLLYNKINVNAPYYINMFHKKQIRINIDKHNKSNRTKLKINCCYRILLNVSRFMYNDKECYKLNALRIDNIPVPINNDEYLFI